MFLRKIKMAPSYATVLFLLLTSSFIPAGCWDSEDFELFDLVEEVGENFYDYFGVSQVCIDYSK